MILQNIHLCFRQLHCSSLAIIVAGQSVRYWSRVQMQIWDLEWFFFSYKILCKSLCVVFSSYVRKQNRWLRILKYTLFLYLVKLQVKENARWTIWLQVLTKMETKGDNSQENVIASVKVPTAGWFKSSRFASIPNQQELTISATKDTD